MRKFTKRLRALWRRRQLDRDLEDELSFHVAVSAEESGDLSIARRRLGNFAAVKENCRDLWAFTSLESWWQDPRHAFRTLASNPLVTRPCAEIPSNQCELIGVYDSRALLYAVLWRAVKVDPLVALRCE